MIAYIDASVLLRIALGQADALSERRRIDRGVSSALILTECLRTLDRPRLRARLPDKEVALRRATILSLLATLEIVEIDAAILDRAAQPMPTEPGTLDAIHLATALLWQESMRVGLVMATHDVGLALAAQADGLTVVGCAAAPALAFQASRLDFHSCRPRNPGADEGRLIQNGYCDDQPRDGAAP